MTKRHFILDTDIGSDIDDAMALLLCLRIQHFPLAAVTTVYNCVELRARVAKKILMLDHRVIPVGVGLSMPIDKQRFLWSTGNEGKGILSEEELNIPLDEIDIIEDGINLTEAYGMSFTKKVPIDIQIDRDGSTWIQSNPESNHEICWSVDSERFINWYLDVVCKRTR